MTNRVQRRVRYWHTREALVPEQVLAVLEALPAAQRQAVLDQLISANRALSGTGR